AGEDAGRVANRSSDVLPGAAPRVGARLRDGVHRSEEAFRPVATLVLRGHRYWFGSSAAEAGGQTGTAVDRRRREGVRPPGVPQDPPTAGRRNDARVLGRRSAQRSEEHTSELQSLT